MNLKLLFSLIFFVAVTFAQDSSEECEDCLPLAEVCDVEACQLPSCRCSSTNIPGDLLPRDTPQFVVVTFDEAINVINIMTYRDILFGRTNSNGCQAGATFYVNHEYTDYSLVNEIYNNGFEVALQSISRQTSQAYWAGATYETMVLEYAQQRSQMAHFANIPFDAIQGMRIPFLQMAGNASFDMMSKHGFLYDHTWPTIAFSNPGLWPYTLDYASTQDCINPPCPTASIPRPWVLPIVSWIDLMGFPCTSLDACFAFPDREDENAWYEFILTNFERHYLSTRAPFPLAVTQGFLTAYPAVQGAVIRFLNLVNSLNDAFMVNASEVIEWLKEPTPVNEYRSKACRTFIPTTCPLIGCGPYEAEHNGMLYWLQLCNVCPRVYPWLGNPLGQ